MYLCVDFDGTIVTHEFPRIGEPIPGAIDVLRELQYKNHNLILWTMRSDTDKSGNVLTQAVDYLLDNGIKLFGINENPTQTKWTTSPKAYGHFYIDDAAIGCPLIYQSGRPFVDWITVRKILVKQRLL